MRSLRHPTTGHVTLLAAALCALLLSMPLLARDRDHEHARKSLEAGEILPLRAILEKVERDYPGQIIEVELEREAERWVYKLKLLRANGALVKMKLDAADATLLGIKGRDIAPASKPEGVR
ncbi:MAG: PepSY domain-containing protein [Gammaproteobacteria bacterium]|nr:PepSY domain-containing protein [Gammaproteobacteria bacterium]